MPQPSTALIALALSLLLVAGTRAGAQPMGLEPVDHAVCRLIETAARGHNLPVGFLTRVIWRESSFRAGAVSSAGAEGIAQFMPGTARERGLSDPFDPEEAIPKAASLLADLRQQFGNLRNAAAAYNAGPARVAAWLKGQGDLPAVTYSYMQYVTTWNPEDALGDNDGFTPMDDADIAHWAPQTCLTLAAGLRRDDDYEPSSIALAPLAPWGVQLAGNFSKSLALATFERVRHRYARVIGDATPMVIGRVLRYRGWRRFYMVSLPAGTRQAASALCGRIVSVGGICVVVRS